MKSFFSCGKDRAWIVLFLAVFCLNIFPSWRPRLEKILFSWAFWIVPMRRSEEGTSKERAQLAIWVDLLGRLEALEKENSDLKKTIGALENKPHPSRIVSAKPIGNPFLDGKLLFPIDLGSSDGVQKGDLVLSSSCHVLGRVGHTTEKAAQIVPIGNSESKWLAHSEISQDALVLQGNAGKLKCILQKKGNPLVFGEKVFLEEKGVIYEIGTVQNDEKGRKEIFPSIQWNNVDWIHILVKV